MLCGNKHNNRIHRFKLLEWVDYSNFKSAGKSYLVTERRKPQEGSGSVLPSRILKYPSAATRPKVKNRRIAPGKSSLRSSLRLPPASGDGLLTPADRLGGGELPRIPRLRSHSLFRRLLPRRPFLPRPLRIRGCSFSRSFLQHFLFVLPIIVSDA